MVKQRHVIVTIRNIDEYLDDKYSPEKVLSVIVRYVKCFIIKAFRIVRSTQSASMCPCLTTEVKFCPKNEYNTF